MASEVVAEFGKYTHQHYGYLRGQTLLCGSLVKVTPLALQKWKTRKEIITKRYLLFFPFSLVERVKADSAQASVDLLEEMEKKHVQMMKERERRHQERVRQLTEKMDDERAQIVKEQERILALKLQVLSWVISALSFTVLSPKHSRRLNIIVYLNLPL